MNVKGRKEQGKIIYNNKRGGKSERGYKPRRRKIRRTVFCGVKKEEKDKCSE